MGQVLTQSELIEHLRKDRKSLGSIVFTNGCFDILHVGHVRYLQQARALGGALVVGLNSDSSVRKLKGPERPLQCEGDRAEVLAALEAVSFVTLFSEDTPLQLIEAVAPDVLVKGGDWAPEKIVGAPFVLSRGGQVKSLPFVEGRSTSKVVEKIKRL